MFNFIVKFAGWNPDRDTIGQDRVFEYTDAEVEATFAPGGVLDLAKVTTIPTLFASETGVGDDIVRIGRITRVRLVGRTYHIEYALDPEVAGIPNATLEAFAAELDIEAFEFHRGHWAIKDVDLFKVLHRRGAGQRPRPKLFELPNAVDDALVAVMMPFDAAFNEVYESLRAAAHEVGMRCNRADDIWEADTVIQDVVNLIGRARVVVCDLTGRNPNVFYETGLAHMLGRDVVLITQSAGDVPFDVGHIRHLRYLNNNEGRTQLTSDVAARLRGLTGRD